MTEPAGPAPPPAPRGLVLVVDDDADIRGVLSDILERKGYAVATASGGADALRQLEAALRPQLILLDLMMPGMSGLEFLEEQRKRGLAAAAPVVVLSGDAGSDSRAQLLGAAGFLRKPIELRTLLSTVQRYC